MNARLAIAILLSIQAAQAAVYQDPHGRFTAPAPAGWAANALGPSVAISRGAAYTMINSTAAAVDAAIAQTVEPFARQWRDFQEIKRGDATVGGRRGVYVFCSGVNPKGVAAFLRVTAIGSGAGTWVLMSSSPQAEFAGVKAAFDEIERGFTLAGTAAPPSQPPVQQQAPAAGKSYDDPKHRFRLAVPAGWAAQRSPDGGAKLSLRNAYAQVMVYEGGQGQVIAGQVIQQVGSQWKDWQVTERNQATVMGNPGMAMTGTGVNPKGVPAMMRVIAGGAPERTLVLLMSAPQSEMASARPGLEEIERSFVEGAGAPRAALGIAMGDITPQDAQSLGVTSTQGSLVAQLGPDSAAGRAGIKPGDIIVAIDEKAVQRSSDLQRMIAERKPGDRVELVVIRGGRPGKIQVTLGGT
jgi:hypothetical protein